MRGRFNRDQQRVAHMRNNNKALSPEQRKELLGGLKARFEKNMSRHQGLEWLKVASKAGG